mmetsp:Transcript_118365/g.252713  ORF Transcript_118365/g.252713 Transcript_118365/m.252713 type:complete len:218 (-) Transcript_118365:244-897(-)
MGRSACFPLHPRCRAQRRRGRSSRCEASPPRHHPATVPPHCQAPASSAASTEDGAALRASRPRGRDCGRSLPPGANPRRPHRDLCRNRNRCALRHHGPDRPDRCDRRCRASHCPSEPRRCRPLGGLCHLPGRLPGHLHGHLHGPLHGPLQNGLHGRPGHRRLRHGRSASPWRTSRHYPIGWAGRRHAAESRPSRRRGLRSRHRPSRCHHANRSAPHG